MKKKYRLQKYLKLSKKQKNLYFRSPTVSTLTNDKKDQYDRHYLRIMFYKQ